ncbi:protein GVQW1-like [Lemur catta]|uniref:protein GVQW1-like n=1 Tax=Lemur catta TaxID=9447 RepID=UPI001E26C20C|nr:protein GVQW1-like [Lemur catta]
MAFNNILELPWDAANFVARFFKEGRGSCLPGGWRVHSEQEQAASAKQWAVSNQEVGFRYAAHSGLQLLASSDSPTSASQNAGITGTRHHAQPVGSYLT